MHILVLNGSPKGERSNTYRLTQAFLKGMGRQETRIRTLRDMTIKPCLGCFACWSKTPGKCCLSDDMASVIEDILWADTVIWSFPLYYFSVPGPVKNLMDRQLPMSLPFMSAEAATGGHPSRFDMSGKGHVVISTCGFYTARGNYDGVTAIFDHLCGKGQYTTIFCGQGELFRVKELSARTDEYLSWVTDAGSEYVGGGITQKTREKLETLLYPRQVFEAMADASWGVEKTGEKTEESLTFTRQMAALYNPKAHKGKDIVLEMAYTDIGKTYQLLLTAQGSEVLTENLLPGTTRIETTYALWKSIAAGEISGERALMEGKYRVKGDFDLMIHWDEYFGSGMDTSALRERPGEKPTNMLILLLPWTAFWAGSAMDAFYGAIAAMGVCALVPLLFFRNRKTVYDALSGAIVAALSGLLLLGVPEKVVLILSFLGFGIPWTVSCFLRVPLTALYSMNQYGGENALNNPLFVRTNRILTACWGIMYLVTAVCVWLSLGTPAESWTPSLNSILPTCMGIFTAWFQKWYPAKVARG